jgi:ferritin
MKIIEKLANMIEDEINDAEKYARCALKEKEERPTLAQTFYSLATDEMKHMTMLHDEVTRIINDYRAQGNEPPAEMIAIYDYLHKKHIEHATNVKIIMESYRN